MSAATIKIIQDNDTLARVEESDATSKHCYYYKMHSARVSCTLTLFMVVRNYTAEFLSFYDYHTYKEFQDLIHETQVISRWLIGVSSVILIAVIVDLVLTVVTDIFNITFYLQLTIGIIVNFVKQILTI